MQSSECTQDFPPALALAASVRPTPTIAAEAGRTRAHVHRREGGGAACARCSDPSRGDPDDTLAWGHS